MSNSAKDTSSSSGVVFAKATKEWVLPSRAKPGRKAAPKKGESSQSQAAAPSPTPSTSASTTTHNREAQRAFRERKSSYLTSLETRIEAYERGEVERNVALQAAAQRVNEENARLREELREAKEELAKSKREIDGLKNQLNTVLAINESGRRKSQQPQHQLSWSADPSHSNPTLASTSLPRHPYIKTEPTSSLPSTSLPLNPLHPITPPSDTSSSSQSPPASRLAAPTPMESYIRSPPTSSPSHHSHPSDSGEGSQQGARRIEISPCGFCTGLETVCVCRMVAEEEALSSSSSALRSSSSPIVHTHGIEPSVLHPALLPSNPYRVTGTVSLSLLDNPPPPEPAVPLKRKAKSTQTGVVRVPIFAVAPAEVVEVVKKVREAECSGDPANCDACRDDTWGRQFCERLVASRACCSSSQPCINCLASSSTTNTSISLPGPSSLLASSTSGLSGQVPAPVSCGGANDACSGGVECSHAKMEVERGEEEGRFMGADEAWRTLKAHPNARFTSLDLLADVVSKRTRCLGSRVELSPPRQLSPGVPAESAGLPRLVPLEELVVAGKKRRLEVQADGVKEALALLDSQSDKYKRRKMSGAGEFM